MFTLVNLVIRRKKLHLGGSYGSYAAFYAIYVRERVGEVTDFGILAFHTPVVLRRSDAHLQSVDAQRESLHLTVKHKQHDTLT